MEETQAMRAHELLIEALTLLLDAGQDPEQTADDIVSALGQASIDVDQTAADYVATVRAIGARVPTEIEATRQTLIRSGMTPADAALIAAGHPGQVTA